MPLGHPAHTLNAGKTTLGAGVAGRVIGSSSATSADGTAVRLQQLTVAPDMSPWVAARVGLGNDFEAGVSASTRAIRIDGRRAFVWDSVALSIGLGASALMAVRPSGGGNASGVYGGGFDVPILIGWRSSADLYAAWIGPRVGAELFSGQLDPGTGASPNPASGRHLHVGGTAGLRAGLRRLYGVVEAQLAYHVADGTLGGTSLTLTGWSVTPAGALVVSF
jgi:hypothetical protein